MIVSLLDLGSDMFPQFADQLRIVERPCMLNMCSWRLGTTRCMLVQLGLLKTDGTIRSCSVLYNVEEAKTRPAH